MTPNKDVLNRVIAQVDEADKAGVDRVYSRSVCPIFYNECNGILYNNVKGIGYDSCDLLGVGMERSDFGAGKYKFGYVWSQLADDPIAIAKAVELGIAERDGDKYAMKISYGFHDEFTRFLAWAIANQSKAGIGAIALGPTQCNLRLSSAYRGSSMVSFGWPNTWGDIEAFFAPTSTLCMWRYLLYLNKAPLPASGASQTEVISWLASQTGVGKDRSTQGRPANEYYYDKYYKDVLAAVLAARPV
jgi:hypothetical protein